MILPLRLLMMRMMIVRIILSLTTRRPIMMFSQ